MKTSQWRCWQSWAAEGAPTPPPEPFELDGGWTYLGPSDGPHHLTIADDSMAYADVGGTWSSDWTIKAYDNELHQFQVTFKSGSGTYLPVGQSMSGIYDLSGSLLTVQLANGLASYPPLKSPGTCTTRDGWHADSGVQTVHKRT